MTSTASTIGEYIASLPEDRRAAIGELHSKILEVLPPGYEPTMQYGMISYVVPHSRYPAGYHCDPKQAVTFVSLGSQKNHMALYLMCVYGGGERADQFREKYLATGKKLDMGAACLRFKKLEDLAVDVVLETIASIPVDKYLATYEAAIPPSKRPKK